MTNNVVPEQPFFKPKNVWIGDNNFQEKWTWKPVEVLCRIMFIITMFHISGITSNKSQKCTKVDRKTAKSQ